MTEPTDGFKFEGETPEDLDVGSEMENASSLR